MKCPTCKNKMESERVGKVVSTIDGNHAKVVAHTHYRCDHCDSEYVSNGPRILQITEGAAELRCF